MQNTGKSRAQLIFLLVTNVQPSLSFVDSDLPILSGFHLPGQTEERNISVIGRRNLGFREMDNPVNTKHFLHCKAAPAGLGPEIDASILFSPFSVAGPSPLFAFYRAV